ncbi:MAG: tetratricopeptide repeat protein [Myxococcales bacterium]|nr:tetratricopeptide repeat protein [Myxococcales bacterium]
MSGSRGLRALALAAALGVLGASTPAAAQPAVSAASTERARALFHEGLSLADHDRWAEALAAFQQSLGLVPRASTRFNLARALLRLGRLREAIEVFDVYRAEASGPGEVERLGEAARLRAEAVQSLATLQLSGLPDESEVSIDGAVESGRGERRALRIDPGLHRVEVRDRAGHVERFTITATAAQVTAHALVWPSPSQGAGGRVARPNLLVTPPPTTRPRGSVLTSPWLWVGVGAAAAVTAGVLVYVLRPTEEPYGGTTNTVISGIRFDGP